MDERSVDQIISTHDTGIDSLTEGLEYFYPVSQGIREYLQAFVVLHTIKKKEMLLRAGMICKHVYFIKKGAIRGFIKQGHKDFTTWISAEREFVTAIPSLNKQSPSREYIEAIEDCELFALDYASLEILYREHPEFNIIVRKLLQKYYEDAEGRAFVVRLTKAEDKYNYFLDKYQNLAHRIPLKHIASFLGMTQETLSRIRKKAIKTKRIP